MKIVVFLIQDFKFIDIISKSFSSWSWVALIISRLEAYKEYSIFDTKRIQNDHEEV